MAQNTNTHRFGPDVWVTVGSTGEHVRVELWSAVADAYRVRSVKGGVQFFDEAELEEMAPHPEEDLGRSWARCHRNGCGAPLTDSLQTCEHCKARICTCGRCGCATTRRTKSKKPAKNPTRTAKAV